MNDAGFELTFGECEGLCGGMVERVGWDRYCFACQEEMRLEDEEREEALYDEDAALYGIPADAFTRAASLPPESGSEGGRG